MNAARKGRKTRKITQSAFAQPFRLGSRKMSMMTVMKIQMHAIRMYTQKIQTRNSHKFTLISLFVRGRRGRSR